MKQCAIVLNGNDIIKVSNLKRKYKKIISNDNMKILEECDKDQLDQCYNSWKSKYSTSNNDNEDVVKKYYFKNNKTGYTIVSIYPELNKEYVNDWRDYRRIE